MEHWLIESSFFTARIWLLDFFRYFLIAGSGYLVVQTFFIAKDSTRQTGPQIPKRKQMFFEIKHSMKTTFIFGLVGGIGYFAAISGLSQAYQHVGEFGYSYLFFTIVVLLVAHDAYFYFFHRLLHHPRVYSWGHAVHHRSVSPSPWAALSFNWVEALGHSVYVLMMTFILPLHYSAILVFSITMMTFNVIGHLGFEIYPHRWLKIPVMRLKTTVTHHALHHSDFNSNYGLYFCWWDRFFKTEHPRYESIYASNTADSGVLVSAKKAS